MRFGIAAYGVRSGFDVNVVNIGSAASVELIPGRQPQNLLDGAEHVHDRVEVAIDDAVPRVRD